VIELLITERCTKCNECVAICPSNVFDSVPGGAPIIARQTDCQTCYMCEMYCAADALFVGSNAQAPEPVDEAAIIASGWLGQIRRDSGWGEWAADPRYRNQQWYMGEVFKRGFGLGNIRRVDMTETDSVNKRLADLHAERVATYKPEDLAVNINQRQLLVDTADRATFIKPGDIVAPFSLPEADGGQVVLDELLANGPAVLVFFRFAGCPACNIALPYYQRQLHPALAARGVPLVAISPQIPERLIEIKERHKLGFFVASDTGNALGRNFGITFTANEESQRAMAAKGADLGQITGTGTWELPMPAAIVIGQDRVVRFADISPDWLIRTEADPILRIIDAVKGVAKAA
jgi:peroxiredoxin/NAD-dependent dihydropyrimidine dehydrogenase PreA subunit